MGYMRSSAVFSLLLFFVEMKSMAISGNENDEKGRKERVRCSEMAVGLTDNPLFY